MNRGHMKYVARKHNSVANITNVETMQSELATWFQDELVLPMLNENVNIMMLNDVYFNGFWESGFDAQNTKIQNFYDEENNVFQAMLTITRILDHF